MSVPSSRRRLARLSRLLAVTGRTCGSSATERWCFNCPRFSLRTKMLLRLAFASLDLRLSNPRPLPTPLRRQSCLLSSPRPCLSSQKRLQSCRKMALWSLISCTRAPAVASSCFASCRSKNKRALQRRSESMSPSRKSGPHL